MGNGERLVNIENRFWTGMRIEGQTGGQGYLIYPEHLCLPSGKND